jgi:TPR repeat protein
MRMLLVLMFACTLGALARAGPLQDAQAAYDRGKYAVALDLWQPLAEQGDPDAQAALGNLYLGGYGVARDEAAAMAWFRKAADQGHENGQFSLASLYYGRKEYSPAASWYRRAAEQGNALAQIRLARMYTEGPGLTRDDVQAFKWFAVAAMRGSDSYARTNAVKGRDAVAMKMTPPQVAEAERLVREWKPKSEVRAR